MTCLWNLDVDPMGFEISKKSCLKIRIKTLKMGKTEILRIMANRVMDQKFIVKAIG